MAKGSLLLVGLGIGDEKGISCEGIAALRSCKKVFAECYTNLLPKGTLKRLERLIQKPIAVLGREEVEGESIILSSAMKRKTALVVPGDPLIATTHISLAISAKKRKIPVQIIHSSSILSAAIGESGLQAYKFGKVATLAYWKENYKPKAAYDVIAENLSRGLHTLLLLDIDEKLGPMAPKTAAGLLLQIEAEEKRGIFSPKTKVILLQGVGRSKQTAKYCSLEELARLLLPPVPAVLIVPGKLHFLEEEFLSLL
ncbi:MAG: diphthine synthase [Candidatus Micrarchaeota archaeon]|nr:diphthine synthase [Candidatus Micrarchaeota archaeon]